MIQYYQSLIETSLGQMIAVADDSALHQLEFIDTVEQKVNIEKGSGQTAVLDSIELELEQYFDGKLKEFKTPIALSGTPFQVTVWNALIKISYGDTQSYAQVANGIHKPTSYRAAAQANGANRLAIIVPCHRVINANGKMGGYNGGLQRKEWLLKHEKEYM